MRTTVALAFCLAAGPIAAQTPPSMAERTAYEGLHAAAISGDLDAITRRVADGADVDDRDGAGRTPVHVAAFASEDDALALLAQLGADMNALEGQAYDAVTIAAVADDPALLSVALAHGNRADLITSPYNGTALIAAAHLGHVEVVRLLIAAGAPLDHVNNLGWTALIEAVVLGDGGPDHREVARLLLEAGADPAIPDRTGATPLQLAEARGYDDMAELIEAFSP